MRVGILGTGTVGRAIGARLVELGHKVMIGTRNGLQRMTLTLNIGFWSGPHSRSHSGRYISTPGAVRVEVGSG